MQKMIVVALFLSASFAVKVPALADCPALNISKGVDDVARHLLNGKGLNFLFLGTIVKEKFIGDFRRIYDLNADESRDITYHVEDVFFDKAFPTITLRTPFFCEACSYANQVELEDGLKSEVGRRVIVFEWEEIDANGQRKTNVSGGCPDSIDASSFAGKENDLVVALRKLHSKK